MSDFIKLFRRQKSVKQEVNDNSGWTAETRRDSRDSSHSDLHAHASLNQEHSNLHDDVSRQKQHDAFKETKSWRKSFRKLRWKKRDHDVNSVSSENIFVFPTQSTENVPHATPKLSSKVNKRWSYSPDLCEDNVPGAKELRGRLERKLSVKREADEQQIAHSSNVSSTPVRKFSLKKEGSLASYSMFGRERDVSFSTFSPRNSMKYHSAEGQNCFSQPLVPTTQITQSGGSAHLNSMHELSQSEPAFTNYEDVDDSSKKRSSSASITQCAEDRPQLHTMVNQNMYSSKIFSAEETPEEEEEPYELQSIEEALGEVDPRTATLRSLHGQAYDANAYYLKYDQEDSALHSVTGTLMRGRAATQYERAAEHALENLNYENYSTLPVDHYYQDLNDEHQGNSRIEVDSSENELRTTDTEDYGCEEGLTGSGGWATDEFSSSESEGGKCEEDSRGPKPEPGVSKSDRFSKDIGKLKFWERTSVKKKNSSPARPPEPESNSIPEVEIPAKHHVIPELPSPVPENLTKNQQKRRNIVQQIIRSEQAYIDSLQRLEIDYKQALLEHKPVILSPDVVEKIFHKVSAILQCHRLFQMDLASTATTWDEYECIGETFVASFSKTMVLECYGAFINNFTTAMDIVRKTCIRKPQFLSFLRDRQAESQDRLNLYGLMLKPVQRFPQFIMFVQDLLKYTPSSHPDLLPLHLALTELETLAERLNYRKAEDEDAADLRNLLENSNLKLASHAKDGRPRKLIKQAEIRECEHNEESLIEKMKDCLLVLTNDMLICCSISNRRPYQKTVSSTSKDMYKVKWRVGIDVVEVIDGSLRPSTLVEREALHSDFIHLQQIGKLVGKLQLSHEGISTQVIDKCVSAVETKIRQAEQLASQPENASFTVKFPSKSGNVVRTIVSSYASQKDEWLETIFRAKLANAPENLDAWFSASSSDGDATGKSPLFLRSLAAHQSYETLQVQCAHAFMPAGHVTLLWLSCSASTVLSIVSIYHITEDRVEKIHVMQVESSVQCMQHWNPFGCFNSMWLGMESGCLLEYSASDGSYRKISEVPVPTMSTVMIMEAHESNLYVGLLDGTLAMYSRPAGTFDLHHVSSITVGTGPLVSLSPVEDKLWGCSGNNVVTIDISSFNTESSRSLLLQGESRVVKLVTRVGNGLWVNFNEECVLFLYHLASLERLQEVNLSRAVRDFVQGLDPPGQISEQCHVASLWNGHSKLFVGMSNGLLLVMPLPKLAGSVPKITGATRVSRHSVRGPLAFLFAPEVPQSSPKLSDVTEEDSSVLDEDRPPPIPERDDLNETGGTLVAEDQEGQPKQRSGSRAGFSEIASPRSHNSHYNCSRSPRIPPRPNELPLSAIPLSPCELLPEDKTVYEHETLKSIESPRKATFVQWKDKKSRHCPVVIACGEGYRHFGSQSASNPLPNRENVPTIICWKVV